MNISRKELLKAISSEYLYKGTYFDDTPENNSRYIREHSKGVYEYLTEEETKEQIKSMLKKMETFLRQQGIKIN